MLDKAVMVNGDCIVCAREKEIYNNDINVTCNALSMLFIKSNLTEMNGGTIFLAGCPDLDEAGVIIAAKFAKIVVNREPTMSDELAARELLLQNNIDFIVKPEIIL